MKRLYLFFILSFLLLILVGCSFGNNTKNPGENNSVDNTIYNTQKLAIQKPIEKVLYSFSTQILDKDSGRQNNIRLTCDSLSGTIVKAGETFSFCDTVGKATPEKGYQEAKIFDANGNVTEGLGGGNCQVSSTLYNAVLKDSNFEIVERHPHAQRVYYVEQGKDAAVACGSVDFKFKNNNLFDIRIDASTDGNYVYVDIVKIG